MKRIAVLCSGGDSQGMNTCVKTLVNMGEANDIKVYGIRYGYRGLLENNFVELKSHDVSTIATLGGSFLKTARCPEFKEMEAVKKGVTILKKNKIDCLIVVGGDGSFRGCMDLAKVGGKTIAIPGTIDNDLYFSERTLGFDTAVNNAVQAIEDIRQPLEANDRAGIFEVMGRDCGDIALYSGVAAGAHSIVVKEERGSIEQIVADVKKCLKQGIKSPMIIISENTGINIMDVKKALLDNFKLESRETVLGYLQRGGEPSIADKTFAIQLAIAAIKHVQAGNYNVALGLKNKEIYDMNIFDAVKFKGLFNTKLYHDVRDIYNLNSK